METLTTKITKAPKKEKAMRRMVGIGLSLVALVLGMLLGSLDVRHPGVAPAHALIKSGGGGGGCGGCDGNGSPARCANCVGSSCGTVCDGSTSCSHGVGTNGVDWCWTSGVACASGGSTPILAQ
jgi:hypothetical protein